MKIGFLSSFDLNLYLFRLDIMRELIKRGYEVYAISPKGEYSDNFKEYNITHIEYKLDRSSLNPLLEMSSIDSIYEAILPLKLDLIHTFTSKANIYGTIAAKKAKIPIILNLVEGLGSFYIDNNFKNRVVRLIMEKLYKKAFNISNKVVFVNSDDPTYMIKKGIIKEQKVKVIKSVGINTKEFSPKNNNLLLKKSLGLKDEIVVLMVARAIWHKGIREFYEVAKRFDKSKVRFIFVGDIDIDNQSSATKEFLNASDVLWLGHRDDIKALTSLADIYTLPSYREGVPRTLLEAASMEKPIVTTDSVGCREVVEDGVNGFLVPIKDVENLYKKIKILVNDRDLREEMGKRGREKALREFDIDKVVQKYLMLYSEYINV